VFESSVAHSFFRTVASNIWEESELIGSLSLARPSDNRYGCYIVKNY
jgi:hypothetical protein